MAEILKILSDEHKIILKVINKLNEESDKIEKGEEINKEFFTKAIDFIRNYADKFHHAKEEDILFKEINNCENMHCNPVEQMLNEHEISRDLIKNLEEGIKENDKEKVIENARQYAILLKEHISKEDDILYPMADDALTNESKEQMLKQFKEIEQKKEKEKYLSFANSL